MNMKVYVLALSAFIAGMVELVVGGILPSIAEDLHVSISVAGQLISVFSLVWAVSGPILLALTAKVERKRLYLWTLFFFFIGNLIAFVSPNYEVLMLSRIFKAMSGALIVVLSLTITARIVTNEYRARALGVIFMGISGSLVLGVPIGVLISDVFGWRAPFALIACLTLVQMIVISRFLTSHSPGDTIPLRQQLASLLSQKIVSAHLVTVFMLAGNYMLYAYFTPFLQTTLNLNSLWISATYFLLGIASVTGGGVGGWIGDRWGVNKSMIMIVALFALMMVLMPVSTFIPLLFPVALIVWGMSSWAISPVQQSYLIQTAPKSAGIQQSFNNSAVHLGIALGSAAGGLVVSMFPVVYTAWFGAVFVMLALGCAVFSLTRTVSENL